MKGFIIIVHYQCMELIDYKNRLVFINLYYLFNTISRTVYDRTVVGQHSDFRFAVIDSYDRTCM